MKLISRMLKAIHAQESKEAAREKAKQVAATLREMRLNEAAKKLDAGIEETLTYMIFEYSGSKYTGCPVCGNRYSGQTETSIPVAETSIYNVFMRQSA